MAEKINESQQVRFVNPNGSGLAMMNTSPYHIPFILQRIEGIGGVEANISSQKSPYQDGTSFFSANLEPRDVSIRVTINARNRKELFEYREYVQKVFYPSHGEGILIVQHGDKIRMTYAVAETTPTFFDYIGNQVSFVVSLVASDPFWYQVGENGGKILSQNDIISISNEGSVYGAGEFPDKRTQLFTGTISSGTSNRTLTNEGLAQTPFKLIIPEATDYKLVKKRTGEKIEVTRPIQEGDVLIIQTELGNRKVSLLKPDGTVLNAFNYLSRDSTFFYLDSGINELELSRSTRGRNVDMAPRIVWSPRYSGI